MLTAPAGSSAKAIALLTVGGVLLVATAVYESLVPRSPIVPPRIFRVTPQRLVFAYSTDSTAQTRTTGIILFSTFIHSVMFFACTYYLPLYFQVLGSSATGSGVRMLPFSLFAALIASVSGWLITRFRDYQKMMWFAWVRLPPPSPCKNSDLAPQQAILVLGFGLMTTLDDRSNQ